MMEQAFLIEVLTNNPRKIVVLAGHGLEVVEQMPINIPAHEDNKHYLDTKRERMGHLI